MIVYKHIIAVLKNPDGGGVTNDGRKGKYCRKEFVLCSEKRNFGGNLKEKDDFGCCCRKDTAAARELKVRDILICAGLECYVPMTVRVSVRNGVEYRKDVPAVSNLCFVRSFRKELDDILVSGGMRSYVSYIWDRCTREPCSCPG